MGWLGKQAIDESDNSVQGKHMSYSYVITEEAAVNNDDIFEFGEY